MCAFKTTPSVAGCFQSWPIQLPSKEGVQSHTSLTACCTSSEWRSLRAISEKDWNSLCTRARARTSEQNSEGEHCMDRELRISITYGWQAHPISCTDTHSLTHIHTPHTHTHTHTYTHIHTHAHTHTHTHAHLLFSCTNEWKEPDYCLPPTHTHTHHLFGV